MVTGLLVFFWVYRRGKAAVLLDGAQDELKKIKRIQVSSGAIDAGNAIGTTSTTRRTVELLTPWMRARMDSF